MRFTLFGIGPVKKLRAELARLQTQLVKSKEDTKKAKERLRHALDALRKAGGIGFDASEPGRYFERMDPRKLLSMRYLRGDGLEVGALHCPTGTAENARTRYYDRYSREENIERHPELNPDEIVHVDYVGDGERLEQIEDDSLDYLICNHMLEHCQDVISTLLTFWRKLRSGGVLYVSLPDKRYTFDYKRNITPFEHLVSDHQQGPHCSLYEHYVDFYTNVDLPKPSELPSEEAVRAMADLDLHFHAWTQAEMLEMLVRIRREFGVNWEVEAVMRNGVELIMVLRKEDVICRDRAEGPR